MLVLFALLLFAGPANNAQAPVVSAPARQEGGQQQQDILADLRQRNIEIQFTGNKVFSNEGLLDLLAHDAPKAVQYLTEDVKDEEKMDYGLRFIRYCLAAQGYLRAQVGRPSVEPTEHGYRLVVPIREGALYRIGQIKINGAVVFTVAQIRDILAFKEGDLASGEIIYQGIFERLKQAYGDRGYIQFSAAPDPTFQRAPRGAMESTVDYEITIDEGKLFTVQSIEFAGNDTVPDEVLRAALRLKVDQPCSVKLLAESIDRLNDLGLFALIDKERDVDFKQNEEAGLIKIVIKLRERSQP